MNKVNKEYMVLVEYVQGDFKGPIDYIRAREQVPSVRPLRSDIVEVWVEMFAQLSEYDESTLIKINKCIIYE